MAKSLSFNNGLEGKLFLSFLLSKATQKVLKMEYFFSPFYVAWHFVIVYLDSEVGICSKGTQQCVI